MCLNINSFRFLSKIFEEVKNKNHNVRVKIANYFLLVLLHYDPIVLKQHSELIEEFLVKFLQDAKPEVRSVARICFVRYKQVVTQNKWLKLQRSLTASNQRVLEELDEASLVE